MENLTFYEAKPCPHSVTVARNLGADAKITYDRRPEVAHRPYLISVTGSWEQMYDFSDYMRTRERKGEEVDLFIVGDPKRHYRLLWLTDKEAATLESCGEQVQRRWADPESPEREDPIHYFEVTIHPPARLIYNDYSLCIRGLRKPSLKEAQDFLLTGECIDPKEIVVDVEEISEESALEDYNIPPDGSGRVFGMDIIGSNRDSRGKGPYEAIEDKITDYLLMEAPTEELEDFLGYPISADILEDGLEDRVREVLNQMPEEELLKYEEKYGFADVAD